jgi:glutamine synthetase
VGGVSETAEEVTEQVNALRTAIDELSAQNEHAEDSVAANAEHMKDDVIPAMQSVREAADALERVVPDDEWPLPTYREMLFVK